MSENFSRRGFLGAGIVGGAAIVLSACSTSSSTSSPAAEGSSSSADTGLASLISAAKKEGTLTYYSGVPQPAITPMVAAFTKEYGVQIVVNRQVSSVLGTLMAAEQTSGKVVGDVVQMSDALTMMTAADKGWLLPANPSEMPAQASWPTKYEYTGKGGGTTFLQSLGVYTLAYNTDLAKGSDIPNKWTDLINPKWKNGLIILNDPRASAGALAWIYDLYLKYGASFVQQFGAQNPKLTTSTATGINSVASGECAIIAPSAHWNNTALIAQGAPIADAYPSPSMGGAEEWAGIAKGSPHPNAAKLFLNFQLTQQGQAAECKALCSSVIQAPGTVAFPSDYQSPNLTAAQGMKSKLLSYMNLN
jgi:iron(III) transport system substrate-binding protein